MKECSKCKKQCLLSMFPKRGGAICLDCRNAYSKKWKQENNERLAPVRRKYYANKYSLIQKEKERLRKEIYPLKVRCQLLRSGMRDRARIKNLQFDGEFFTVEYLINRLRSNPNCECCNKILDIAFKIDKKFNDNSPSIDRVNSNSGYTKDNVAILCWRCNKHKQDSSSEELRNIANWMDEWNSRLVD